MKEEQFKSAVDKAVAVLRIGGTILYPTDTIWGIGCDATNAEAVKKVYTIKERDDSKSLVILIAEERDLLKYVAAPPPELFSFLEGVERPTTVVFDGAIGLARNVTAEDGSVAIRLVKDQFCRHLIKRLRAPIVSTSANVSGEGSPKTFRDVSRVIKNRVDLVCDWRTREEKEGMASRIVRWKDGEVIVIRE